jgi:hypothetical protein
VKNEKCAEDFEHGPSRTDSRQYLFMPVSVAFLFKIASATEAFSHRFGKWPCASNGQE